jgi:hypothetical protein
MLQLLWGRTFASDEAKAAVTRKALRLLDSPVFDVTETDTDGRNAL